MEKEEKKMSRIQITNGEEFEEIAAQVIFGCGLTDNTESENIKASFSVNGEKRLLFKQNATSEMSELRLFRKLSVLLPIIKLTGQWLLPIAILRKVPEILQKEMK